MSAQEMYINGSCWNPVNWLHIVGRIRKFYQEMDIANARSAWSMSSGQTPILDGTFLNISTIKIWRNPLTSACDRY